jgi:3,4-dihydroxy 2-butanone 4-phosphate synthase/GTP cyclohydrolase II
LVYLHNTSRGFEIDRTPAEAGAFEAGGAVTPGPNVNRILLHRDLREKEESQDRSRRILRSIGLGGQILSDLGIRRIRLLSNTPMHIPALEGFGLEIVEQVPISVETCNRVK